MSKPLKSGDHVIKRNCGNKIYTVKDGGSYIHEAFDHRYITLQGDDVSYRESDYIKIGTWEELLHCGVTSGIMAAALVIGFILVICCTYYLYKILKVL